MTRLPEGSHHSVITFSRHVVVTARVKKMPRRVNGELLRGRNILGQKDKSTGTMYNNCYSDSGSTFVGRQSVAFLVFLFFAPKRVVVRMYCITVNKFVDKYLI